MEKRPSFEMIKKLWPLKVAVTATVLDPLWDGLKNFHIRAYSPNDGNEVHHLDDWTGCYFPKYGVDWLAHPKCFRAMEFLVYKPEGNRVRVTRKTFKTVFFQLPDSWLKALHEGRRSEMDLLAELEKTNPPRFPERIIR